MAKAPGPRRRAREATTSPVCRDHDFYAQMEEYLCSEFTAGGFIMVSRAWLEKQFRAVRRAALLRAAGAMLSEADCREPGEKRGLVYAAQMAKALARGKPRDGTKEGLFPRGPQR